MKHKIGIHLSYWQKSWTDPLPELFIKAREAGFDVGELPLLYPYAMDFPFLRAALDEVGLLASCGTGLGPVTDITSLSRSTREEGLEHLRACLEGAATLGSPVLGGLTYAPWGAFAEENRRKHRELCVESLKKAGDIAGKLGVRLCLEVVNRFEGYLINTVEQGLELLSEVGHPAVFLHLDTFHMNIEEEDIPGAIRLAGNRLGHFHAVSNTRKAPGTGHLPWPSIRAALEAIHYSGYIVAETFVNPAGEVGRGMFIWHTLAADLEANARETARFLREEVAFDV